MAKLDSNVLIGAARYEAVRPQYAREISRARTARRISVPDYGTLQFETREFAVWHVHELLRAEGWTAGNAARALADVDAWVPTHQEIVATFYLQPGSEKHARIAVRELRGGGHRLHGPGYHYESTCMDTSSREVVWYLRWSLGPAPLFTHHADAPCLLELGPNLGAYRLSLPIRMAMRADRFANHPARGTLLAHFSDTRPVPQPVCQ